MLRLSMLFWPLFFASQLNAYQNNDSDWSPHRVLGKSISKIESNLRSQSWTVGEFSVSWSEASSQLVVSPLSRPRLQIWQSVPGLAFIVAAQGVETVTQWRGSFTIKDQRGKRQCHQQSIDGARVVGDSLEISGSLSGPQCRLSYRFILRPTSDRRLGFEVVFAPVAESGGDYADINRTMLIYRGGDKEGIYGFGEQFTHLNLKGRAVPVLAQEQGHLRGLQPYTYLVNKISPGSAGDWHTTYTGIPQYLSSVNNGLFLEDYEYSLFDFTRPGETEVRLWNRGMRGQILWGGSFLDMIEEYTEYSGRMPRLPAWLHSGAIIGTMGGSQWVRELHRRLKTENTPIAAYWLQDWVGKRDTGLGIRMWWNWELDRSAYPDWEDLVQEFRDDGARVLGYINPFLSDAAGKPDATVNLFREAKEKGYLTKKADGTPAEIDSGGFTGTLVDFSNPDARRWFKDYLKDELFDRGFSGWMADFGEALPFDAVVSSGEPAASYHNRYALEWAKVNQEIIAEAGMQGEAVAFLRTAAARSPGHASLFWLGDQLVTWDHHDGLKSSITGLLSGGFSGMSINHGDIGGLIGMSREWKGIKFLDLARDQELMVRWSEMSAFTPVYRTHEGNNPKRNHQFYTDHLTLKAFSYFAKVFAALTPYREVLLKEASERGYPVVRHPMLHYPDDPVVRDLKFQFMLGSEFMVAPVTEPGRDRYSAYLPAGDWVHLWTGAVHAVPAGGRWIEVEAGLGYPPVFYRKSGGFGPSLGRKVRGITRNFDFAAAR